MLLSFSIWMLGENWILGENGPNSPPPHTHTHTLFFVLHFFSKLTVLVRYYSFPLRLSDVFQFFFSFFSYCQQENWYELPTLRKQNHRIKYFWFSTKGLLCILDIVYRKIQNSVKVIYKQIQLCRISPVEKKEYT